MPLYQAKPLSGDAEPKANEAQYIGMPRRILGLSRTRRDTGNIGGA